MRRALALLLFVSGAALASAVKVTAPPGTSGTPGEYVTLVFRLVGTGLVDVETSADGGATLVASSQHFTLSGEAPYFATVRLPDGARAGTVVSVTVRVSVAGVQEAEASAPVRVRAVAAPRLSLDRDVRVRVGDELEVRGYVSNDGNERDRVSLRAGPGSPWPMSIAPKSIELAPGQSAPITVTILPPENTASGYRYLLRLQATSGADPAKTANAQSRINFIDPEQEAIRRAGSLALVFGVRVSGDVDATLEDGSWSETYQYSVQPNLKGALSDYVKAGLTTTPMTGDEDDPFSPPDSGSLSLQAATWSAGLQASARTVGLTGGVDIGNWHVTLGSGLSFGSGGVAVSASAGLSNLVERPDLTLHSDAFLTSGGHHERFSVRYIYHLSQTVSFGGGAGATGIQQAQGGTYYVIPTLSLLGRYAGPSYSVRADYSTLPTFGRHSASLDVSSRGRRAVSFHGLAQGTLQGADQHANAAVTLYGFPAAGTGLSGTVKFSEAGGSTDYGSLSGSIQATTGFDIGGGAHLGIASSYSRGFPLWGSAASQQGARLALGVSYAMASGQIDGAYSDVGAGSELVPSKSVDAGATVTVAPLVRTRFSVSYRFTDIFYPNAERKHSYGATWYQGWGWGVETALAYERTFDDVAGIQPTQPESLQATVWQTNFLLHGLDLKLGYTIGSDAGLLNWTTPYTHTLSLGLGYSLQVPFKTPEAVVELFGGRKSGALYGRALVQRSGKDAPLAGLAVHLGDRETVTAADGSYEIRLPPGVYPWRFPAGLPATLGLRGSGEVTVVLNQRVHHDLVFQPVENLTVSVFDDANNDGHRDSTEAGIPYAGVTVSGPVTVHARADADGQAVVSNLPAGRYQVSPDPRYLPPKYVPTGSPQEVVINPPNAPSVVLIGAGTPPKTVVTTFQAGDVSVFGSLESGQRPAGADLRVRAQTTGTVSEVDVDLFGKTVKMGRKAGFWQATVRVPASARAGLVEGQVVANPYSGSKAAAPLQLLVTSGPLYTARPVYLKVGTTGTAVVGLLFKASKVSLRVGSQSFSLASDGGYIWRGDVRIDRSGDVEADVMADGRDLGKMILHVQGGPR